MAAPYLVIVVLELALIIRLSGRCWGQYKENKHLELEIEIERLNEMIWDLTEGRGY